MLITDPIGDMIIRIKNALMARKVETIVPHSKIKKAIAEIMKKHKYIEDFEVIDKKPQKEIKIILKYVKDMPAVTGVKRISKPGRRVYRGSAKIPVTLNGYGVTIVSTNKGVLTDQQARKLNVGGEILCQIW